ncbi:MAG TPA: hypothetical protein VLF79_04310 [Candidatus Saccharimonadales bacterium]|nr:hypothetical protein [Candidatus Saccharimonadales bacterium]
MLKLNNKGFSHDILVMLFVVIIAIVGVSYIVLSHAATTPYTSTNDWGNWKYILGTGVTTDLTHSQTSKLLLQFDQGVTTNHISDMAMYQYNLPASTTATSITFNASYADGGYDTVFLAAGTPTNIVWKVSTAANVTNQNMTVNFTNSPTTIYFGIKASGSAGSYGGTWPANRNLLINSYTLNGVTTSSSPQPNVTLSANPTSVTSGGSSTLTWSSTNAASCTASGAWSGTKSTSGTASTGALSANSTYNLSCSGDGGSASASTTVSVTGGTTGGTGGSAGGGTGGTGGNGTLVFDGTFDSGLTKYPTHYFRAGSLVVINPHELQYNITSADSLAGNEGHYRGDILSPPIYPVGVPMCTTIPIQFPNGLATVPHNSWFQFVEAKSPSVDYQGWNVGVSSWYNNYTNAFAFGFQGYAGNGRNFGAPAWVSKTPVDNKIHTFSICTNDASDNTGTIYGIWMDGVRQTFNQGAQAGKLTLSGFPIIKGLSSYPLDINDYTGGSPVPNTIIHGDPLVSTMGSNGLPPMPPGGWTSF